MRCTSNTGQGGLASKPPPVLGVAVGSRGAAAAGVVPAETRRATRRRSRGPLAAGRRRARADPLQRQDPRLQIGADAHDDRNALGLRHPDVASSSPSPAKAAATPALGGDLSGAALVGYGMRTITGRSARASSSARVRAVRRASAAATAGGSTRSSPAFRRFDPFPNRRTVAGSSRRWIVTGGHRQIRQSAARRQRRGQRAVHLVRRSPAFSARRFKIRGSAFESSSKPTSAPDRLSVRAGGGGGRSPGRSAVGAVRWSNRRGRRRRRTLTPFLRTRLRRRRLAAAAAATDRCRHQGQRQGRAKANDPRAPTRPPLPRPSSAGRAAAAAAAARLIGTSTRRRRPPTREARAQAQADDARAPSRARLRHRRRRSGRGGGERLGQTRRRRGGGGGGGGTKAKADGGEGKGEGSPRRAAASAREPPPPRRAVGAVRAA